MAFLWLHSISLWYFHPAPAWIPSKQQLVCLLLTWDASSPAYAYRSLPCDSLAKQGEGLLSSCRDSGSLLRPSLGQSIQHCCQAVAHNLAQHWLFVIFPCQLQHLEKHWNWENKEPSSSFLFCILELLSSFYGCKSCLHPHHHRAELKCSQSSYRWLHHIPTTARRTLPFRSEPRPCLMDHSVHTAIGTKEVSTCRR